MASLLPLELRYEEPAEHFEETILLGNGRVGASLFGGIGDERIYLNDATLWAGGPVDPHMAPEAYTHLPGGSGGAGCRGLGDWPTSSFANSKDRSPNPSLPWAHFSWRWTMGVRLVPTSGPWISGMPPPQFGTR